MSPQSPVRSKLQLVLLVLLLFGAPALVLFSLFDSRVVALVAPAIDGEQPGGRIEGELQSADGAPLPDMAVELELVPASGERSRISVARSDAGGRFSFEAPPVRGHYELVAGGGTWQIARQTWSFVDREGKPGAPRPLVLRVVPGCRLVLRFVRADGGPREDGEYTLRGELAESFFFGLVRSELRRSGKIAAGELVLDALPPLEAQLIARMGSGAQIELAIELAPGDNAKQIDY
jgi:hypothetical protein